MDSRTILTGSGRGPQEPAAKIKDFRNSHGDARTHWRRENEDGSFNVHRDPRNPHVKDNRLWDYEIRIKKKKNSPELSIGHLNSIPGLQDTAHAAAEDAGRGR